MTDTLIKDRTGRVLPWKPEPPEADPELMAKLETFFTHDGDLTDVGRHAGVGPGIFVAAMPSIPRRRTRA